LVSRHWLLSWGPRFSGVKLSVPSFASVSARPSVRPSSFSPRILLVVPSPGQSSIICVMSHRAFVITLPLAAGLCFLFGLSLGAQEDVAAGRKSFETRCARCHGRAGTGGGV